MFAVTPELPANLTESIALLCWCGVDEVSNIFADQKEKASKDFADSQERLKWCKHEFYNEKSKKQLQLTCIENGLSPHGKKHELVKKVVEHLGDDFNRENLNYQGDISSASTSVSKAMRLPVARLKAILNYQRIKRSAGAQSHFIQDSRSTQH